MKTFLKVLVAVLVIAATAVTSYIAAYLNFMSNGADLDAVSAKLTAVEECIETYFVDDYDMGQLRSAAADGAAAAMVEATGDEWSYYLSAEDMQAHYEQLNNAYVGIGVTIQEVDEGFEVVSVTRGGPAEQAGVQPKDILIEVEGQSVAELGLTETQGMVRGEEGTAVALCFLRDGQRLELTITRASIVVDVATAELLDNNIGLITIENFDYHCAEQTIACINQMIGQGAKSLIFDVRFNPGGVKDEMVEILDLLLPAGEVFRSVDYAGREDVDYSDADQLKVPMVVLVNLDSYSAAEFFAAALQEYGVAQIVGSQTYGKGNFQYTISLSDGSAVNISAGKYYTPQGKSLTGVGVTPDVAVDLSEEEYAALYYGTLERDEDDQLQAAIALLSEKNS